MDTAILDHPTLALLSAYWHDKRRGRPLPERRDIDPLEMGATLLPHLLLCDLFDRGTRVRFRLVGTVVVKRLGFDPTGKYLDDVLGGSYGELLAALARLVYCERAPVAAQSLFSWGAGRRMEARHLLLPLAQDGPDPAIALVGMVFRTAEPFPPTIRALAGAGHSELGRAVLKMPPDETWEHDSGRNVA